MLYLDTVTPNLLSIIRTISNEPFFSQFRLVGGTSLSLHLGHRISIDADFFTDKEFSIDAVLDHLFKTLPGFQVLNKSANGLTGIYSGVKIDMYKWSMTFLEPSIEESGIKMASVSDVAALKMEAIINRKEEKDFRDIHALLQKFSMAELIGFFKIRYPQYSPRMLTDSILAVAHVERDMSIRLLKKIKWETIAEELIEHVNLFYAQEVIRRKKKEDEDIKKRIQAIQKKRKDND